MVGLIGWGRFFSSNGSKVTVPAPSDGTGPFYLYDLLAMKASEIALSGFDIVQLPPVSESLGGEGAGCDGYGVFNRRNLNNTRYGGQQGAEKLRRLAAVLQANGVETYLDIVLHQLMGENGGPGVFNYPGADGKLGTGRGCTKPGWFRGNTGNNDPVPPFCKEDQVPAPQYDFAFGRELSYQNCYPVRVTTEDALDFGDWLFRTTGATGARFDDVKGTWSPFVAEFMNSRAMATKTFYSEYFDSNCETLNGWANSSPMNGRSGLEDFNNHFALQSVCAGGSARQLSGAGYSTWNPNQSYLFADNPDTDTSYGEQIATSKLLAYAFLFTISAKMVLVYGKDYYGGDVWPGAYGLKKWIDNLIWVNKTLAYGNTITQYVDDKVIVLNRDGNGGPVGTSPGLLTAINWDTWNSPTISCPTTFGPNAELQDYTGRHGNIWTDSRGWATFKIPSNAYQNGQSFLCFSRPNVEQKPRNFKPAITQTFFGAKDLSVGQVPASSNLVLNKDRIWVAQDTSVYFANRAADKGGLTYRLVDADKNIVNHKKIPATGYYSLGVINTTAVAKDFELEVNYQAPQILTDKELD